MAQNVKSHTVGADASGTVNQSVTSSTLTYNDVKDTMEQTITTSSVNLNVGDVFTIADVYACNPVTKAAYSFEKQFVVVSYASNSLTFSPAIIWDGAFQNVAVTSGVTDLNPRPSRLWGRQPTAIVRTWCSTRTPLLSLWCRWRSPPVRLMSRARPIRVSAFA
jgi:hypothetical protein